MSVRLLSLKHFDKLVSDDKIYRLSVGDFHFSAQCNMSCNSQSRPGIPNGKVRNQISIVLLLPIDDIVSLFVFNDILQTNKMVKSFLLLWLFHLATVLSLSAGKHLANCIVLILIFNSSLYLLIRLLQAR